MRKSFPAVLALSCTLAGARPLDGQSPPAPIDTALARRYFEQAAGLTARDGGRLWGRSLSGPILFVDRASRTLLADSPDTQGLLRPLGALFTGPLPPSENVANTAFEWAGRRWAMIIWPPTADSLQRSVLLAHELWHRVQDSLGFPGTTPGNAHLATRDGRLWLRLEGRALRRAVLHDGSARLAALRDALAFRRERRARFPGSDSAERALELHEGLAEYSGIALASESPAERRMLVAQRLAAMDSSAHFELSFAYQTGPAYGFLLDQFAPEWRSSLDRTQDLGLRLERALPPRGGTKGSVVSRAGTYGYSGVRRNEDGRAKRHAVRVALLKARFVTGPLLELPLAQMKMGFDPGQVEAMDSVGTVYGSLRLTDRWGVLQCDASGGLIAPDFRRAVVPAPGDTAGRRLTGPGWVLELAPNWRIVRGTRRGDWAVVRDQ